MILKRNMYAITILDNLKIYKDYFKVRTKGVLGEGKISFVREFNDGMLIA